ncbi:MAG: tetratricopeptide repeat protein [Cyanobacteria bacterium SIG28]|nr:tetratricopeptide repeat protein [Cyanobacteria bacterium SIG28]
MIKNILQESFILKERGFYKHAIESFYKALEFEPNSVELLYEIAECYLLMGDEEHSLNYIELVLDKEPAHLLTLKLLRNIFINKKAWQEAVKTSYNIYSVSQDVKDLVEIFSLLNKLKNYAEVAAYEVDEYSEAEIIYQVAYAKFFNNELNAAQELVNKVLSKNPNSKKCKILSSKILFKLGDIQGSADILENIEVDFTDADLLNFYGIVEQYLGNYKKALEYFKSAIKLESRNDEYYYNCASTYFKMNEIDIAKKFYNLAISISPKNPNYHFALANLYYSQHNYKRAMEELQYDFFEANLLKAIILFDTGYVALAKTEFLKLLEESPNDDIVLDYLRKTEDKLKI